MNVYRIAGGQATQAALPDLLLVAAAKLGIDPKSVVSSGQTPFRWLRKDLLEVTVRMTTPKGKFSAKLPVAIDASGKAVLQ